jgi:hypothetical protein
MMRFLVATVFACLLSACSLFAAEPPSDGPNDRFVHRAYTVYTPLPSPDGTDLAFVLQPQRVDAESQGVMIQGWKRRVAGDAIVRLASGRVIASVPGGFHHVDYDASAAYVFTSAPTEWPQETPFEDPPRPSQFASVTWLDRSDLGVRGTRTFDPPLEQPYAIGGGLVLDAPLDGTSDVARAVHLVIHDVATADTRTLHDARGFAAFTCRRDGAVTLAYRPADAPGKTAVIDVVFDPVARVARLDIDDMAPTGVACRSGGARPAIVGTRADGWTPRIVVVAREGDSLVATVDVEARVLSRGVRTVFGADLDAGDALLATLSSDGATLLARRPNGRAALFTAGGAVELDEVSPNGHAHVSGDRVLVNDADAGFVVRLDGRQPASTRWNRSLTAASDRRCSGTTAGEFLCMDTLSDGGRIVQAFLVDAAGDTKDVPLDSALRDASVLYADASRVYVLATRGASGEDEAFDVLAIELRTGVVTEIASSVLCSQETIRLKSQCLP